MSATKNTVLTVVLFLAIIGGLTWYLQFMPTWGGPARPAAKPAAPVQEVLKFVRPAPQRGPLHAVWDLKSDGSDAEYALEAEKGEKGEYCFLFQNMLDGTAEVELERVACDCTLADVCIVSEPQWQKIKTALTKEPWAKPTFDSPPEWIKCTKNEHTGVKVPARGFGILRIHWDGRKDPGTMLNLHLWFWCQPEGDVGNRQNIDLIVPVKVVYPLLCDPMRKSVGILGLGEQASAVFHVWSATRNADTLDVSFGPQEKDPLFTVESRPLTDKERADLQAQVNEQSKGQTNTRVRVGFLVTATVHEQGGGQQMDQGPFKHSLPIVLDQALVTFPTPDVTGHVRGPLDVGGEGDRAGVQFKQFSAAESKSVSIPIYGNPQFKLHVAQQEPPFLQVELKHNVKESTPARGRWDLKVTIPSGRWTGPLPESSGVVLVIDPIGKEKARRVRIPVIGTATQ